MKTDRGPVCPGRVNGYSRSTVASSRSSRLSWLITSGIIVCPCADASQLLQLANEQLYSVGLECLIDQRVRGCEFGRHIIEGCANMTESNLTVTAKIAQNVGLPRD
jgi:hypothetical protein